MVGAMPDAFDHCTELVRAADKDRFLATLFAPERYRRALHALYAFNVEIARIREIAREPMPGEIRLQWWRDVFSGPGAGRGGEAAGNPVASAFTATVVRYRLPLPAFEALLEARAFDLYDDPMGSLAELDGYAEKTSSAVMALAARILTDGNDPGASELIRHAGIAYAIAGLLAALPLHAARRQLYVPLDLMQRHVARAEDVFAAKPTPEVRAALEELRQHARDHLAKARALAAGMPPAVVPALLPASLVRRTLDRLDRQGKNPFEVAPLPQWRRQWGLWRAARNPARMFD
jgi:phytoene synthase